MCVCVVCVRVCVCVCVCYMYYVARYSYVHIGFVLLYNQITTLIANNIIIAISMHVISQANTIAIEDLAMC